MPSISAKTHVGPFLAVRPTLGSLLGARTVRTYLFAWVAYPYVDQSAQVN